MSSTGVLVESIVVTSKPSQQWPLTVTLISKITFLIKLSHPLNQGSLSTRNIEWLYGSSSYRKRDTRTT